MIKYESKERNGVQSPTILDQSTPSHPAVSRPCEAIDLRTDHLAIAEPPLNIEGSWENAITSLIRILCVAYRLSSSSILIPSCIVFGSPVVSKETDTCSI